MTFYWCVNVGPTSRQPLRRLHRRRSLVTLGFTRAPPLQGFRQRPALGLFAGFMDNTLHHRTTYQKRQFGVIQGHMPRIRSKQSIHQMGRFAHLSVTLLTQYFSLPLSPVRSDPSKEAVTNDQSRKGNLFDFFCLPSIVVGYPSVRRRELALRSIIPKFKMNASSLLVMGYLASQFAIHPLRARLQCQPMGSRFWDGLLWLHWRQTPRNTPVLGHLPIKRHSDR